MSNTFFVDEFKSYLTAPGADYKVLSDALRLLVPRARLEIAVIDPDYGYKADNTFHPLSETFATLADAQSFFPAATALTECHNFHAVYKAIKVGSTKKGVYVAFPAGFAIVKPPPSGLSWFCPMYADGSSLPSPTTTAYPVLMEGAGAFVTHITIPADADRGTVPGDNSFFMCGVGPGTPGASDAANANTRYAPGASFGGRIKGMAFHGPAAGLSTPANLDVAGCNMNFMCWGAHFQFDDVDISGFYRGLDMVGDHTAFKGLRIRNCYDNIYVNHLSPYIYGDFHFDAKCALTNARRAAIAVHPGGTIGTWHFSGRMFLGTSMYGILKEATPSPVPAGWTINNTIATGLQAEALMFEANGLANIWDDNLRVNGAATAILDRCNFDTVTFSVFDDRFKLPGRDRCLIQVAAINGGRMKNVTQWDVTGCTLPAFVINDILGDFEIEGDIEAFLTQCATAGIAPVRMGGGATGNEHRLSRFKLVHSHGDGNCGPWRGRFYPIYNGTTVAKGNDVSSKFYGVELRAANSLGYPVGLSRQAAANTTSNTQVACAVAEEGEDLPFFPGSGGASSQNFVKQSPTAGCLDNAKSASDEGVIGYCTITSRVRLFYGAKNQFQPSKGFRQIVAPASVANYAPTVAADNGRLTRFKNNTGDLTYTLPANTPVGTEFEVEEANTGAIIWAAASGATINPVVGGATKASGRGAFFRATCVENNAGLTAAVWSIRGSGLVV